MKPDDESIAIFCITHRPRGTEKSRGLSWEWRLRPRGASPNEVKRQEQPFYWIAEALTDP